jgi:ribonuclease P protein component
VTGPEDGAGLSRAARLCASADFSRVFARPRRSVDALFTVLVRSSPAGFARLGLAVSKKQVKRAAVRNRIKRIARESFRQNRRSLGAQDFVVIARAGVAQRSNEAIFASLSSHWQRLSALGPAGSPSPLHHPDPSGI